MRFLFWASLSVLFPTSIAAQDFARDAPRSEAEQLLAEYADCIVAKQSYVERVDTFLRAIPNTDAYGKAAHKAADLTCLNRAARRTHRVITMKMPPSSFRDALYPAMYRRDFARSPRTASIAALPPLTLSAEFDGDVAALPDSYVPRRTLGDCVARANPAQAHAFLLTRPWTATEEAPIEALKPAIAGCLPKNTTLRMNKAALRAFVGEALFKLSVAAGTNPAG